MNTPYELSIIYGIISSVITGILLYIFQPCVVTKIDYKYDVIIIWNKLVTLSILIGLLVSVIMFLYETGESLVKIDNKKSKVQQLIPGTSQSPSSTFNFYS